MSDLGAIVGPSGSGKSTSLRNLDPTKTFIINVANKPLPFKGYKKNYTALSQVDGKWVGNFYGTANVDKIAQVLQLVDKTMPQIKQVIIDDSQYIMSFEAMERASEKGFDKFTQIAQHFYSVLKNGMNMRDDLKVFILTHSENVGDSLNPSFKIKTMGKMIDNMITVEGLFTYVLFSTTNRDDDNNIQYKFMTQNDGTTTAKTPMGCFDSMYIDNDLQEVFNKIDEYNA